MVFVCGVWCDDVSDRLIAHCQRFCTTNCWRDTRDERVPARAAGWERRHERTEELDERGKEPRVRCVTSERDVFSLH